MLCICYWQGTTCSCWPNKIIYIYFAVLFSDKEILVIFVQNVFLKNYFFLWMGEPNYRTQLQLIKEGFIVEKKVLAGKENGDLQDRAKKRSEQWVGMRMSWGADWCGSGLSETGDLVEMSWLWRGLLCGLSVWQAESSRQTDQHEVILKLKEIMVQWPVVVTCDILASVLCIAVSVVALEL